MKILTIFGTRPEAIKMMPVIKEMEKYACIKNTICNTGQHNELLQQVLSAFDIIPEINLDVMQKNQTLFGITTGILSRLELFMDRIKPDLVLVHGDTATALSGAISAFYKQIPVAHIEAGLRSNNMNSPFPEEMNRTVVDRLSSLLFAPTQTEKDNLYNENIKDSVYVTGNTAIDVFKYTLQENYEYKEEKLNYINNRIVLVTAHRRENIGIPLENICFAVRDLIDEYGDIEVVLPMHPNPKVRSSILNILSGTERIHLIQPLDIFDMHNLMNKSTMIMTDSGGVQEEAPYLGVPVVVLRNETERNDSTILAGTCENEIVRICSEVLDSNKIYPKYSPYGDGYAAERIVNRILDL